MFLKFVCAAALLAAPAWAADRHSESGDAVTIRLTNINANNPAALETVRAAFRAAARDACKITGSRVSRSRCVDEFIVDAVAAVKRDDLRIALGGEAGRGGGGRGAVASAPGE